MKLSILQLETAFFFDLRARLRAATTQEDVDDLLDAVAEIRERSLSRTLRARCALVTVKGRGLRARIANGPVVAALVMSIGFIVEAASLDYAVTFLDLVG